MHGLFRVRFFLCNFTLEFLKQKKWFERKINILEVTGNKYFFGTKAKFFSIQSNSKFNIALNFWQPTYMSKFENFLQQTMSSLENTNNWQLYQYFTDINKKLWTKLEMARRRNQIPSTSETNLYFANSMLINANCILCSAVSNIFFCTTLANFPAVSRVV